MLKTYLPPLFNRKDFPLLQKKMQEKPLIYLDSAATSLKPKCVIEAISQFYAHEYGTVHRALYALAQQSTAQYCRVRVQVQKFLNAKYTEEIIFTKGTTESINLVAASFGEAFLKPGDEILISEMEHHSNIVPWQRVCEKQGCLLKIIPVSLEGELDLVAYQTLLSPQVKLVAITHVSNVFGTINPIEEMIALAHAHGAKVLVDGAQSTPHRVIDVQKLKADFLVFSGHKMFGPTGIGILYGKKEILEKMPPYQGGGDMVAKVSFEKTTYQELPLKFEAGTPPIAEVIGLGRAIEYIESVGRDNIATYEDKLLAYATEKLGAIDGLEQIGVASKKGPIFTFHIPGVHPVDIATFLDLEGVAVRTGHLCCQPLLAKFNVPAFIRASFASYNTFEEIDLFAEILAAVVWKIKNPA